MIHFNGYVPTNGWKKFGNGQLLGIELEVVHDRIINSRCLVDIWINRNLGYDKIHVCTDRSVYDGVEIVTHPMSLSEHKVLWCKVLRYLNKANWKADTFRRYPIGLHIHFDTGLRYSEDITKYIYRIGKFMIDNKPKFGLLCGRLDNSFVHWEMSWNSHYNFLNIRKNFGNFVIEFRACKSTIRYPTLIGRLELILALADFASTTREDLRWSKFLVFIGDKYPYLKILMKEKGLIHANRNSRTTTSA